MELSIIITHYQTPELLDLCIKSIKKTIKKIKYEIIVADSESKEETKELISETYPDVKLISFKENAGYSKTVNAGLKKAKGGYILILNADIIVLENAIYKMLKYIRKHPEVGILGPQLLDFTNNIQVSCFSFPSLSAILCRRTFLGKTTWGKKKIKKFLHQTSNIKRQALKVDWIQGSAIMFSKKALKDVGLLDERFFMYFEDTDWCRRFWQKGYQVIYFPAAKMAHYYHRSSKKLGAVLDLILNKYARIHIVSAFKYFWKHRNSHNIKHET